MFRCKHHVVMDETAAEYICDTVRRWGRRGFVPLSHYSGCLSPAGKNPQVWKKSRWGEEWFFVKHFQNSFHWVFTKTLLSERSEPPFFFFQIMWCFYCCLEGNSPIASANKRPLWAVKVLISRWFRVLLRPRKWEFTNLCPALMCTVSPNLRSSHVMLKWAT